MIRFLIGRVREVLVFAPAVVGFAMTLPRDTSAPSTAAPTGPADGPALIGIFENHEDVGTVLHPGSVTYDAAKKSYTLAGSGENMWSTRDAFHYVWKKAAGDLALAADISFVGAGREAHRKACLVIRQGLEADSAYVDVALHGDGLTSLQFREGRGERHPRSAGQRLGPASPPHREAGQLRGDGPGGRGQGAEFLGRGRSHRVSGAVLRRPGCLRSQQRRDGNGGFLECGNGTAPPAVSTGPPVLYSTLETQTISSTDRRVVHVTTTRIEAPNWLRDGSALIYNSGGRIFRVPVAGGVPQAIDTGFATRCNNDHGVSPDGTLLAISDQSRGRRQSLIYTLPITGGTPELITPTGPSYWHGWSPDGKMLAFCGERGGEFDIYTIPAGGGQETRLTTAPGLDDGPEYSPDGKFIYFNSVRTGTMQIWRMKTDGSEQEQVTRTNSTTGFRTFRPTAARWCFCRTKRT